MTAARKNPKNASSGSPSTGEPEYLLVGSLRRPHGVKGEMVMEVHTDFPERLKPGTQVYIGDTYKPMTIEAARFHTEGLLIKFGGIDSPEEAGEHRNQAVYVTTADRPPLPPGQYYQHQLIGYSVVDEAGNPIGRLAEVMRTGANDVYAVSMPDGREVLVPVISSVVLGIDAEQRQIRVHLLPGLLDDEGA